MCFGGVVEKEPLQNSANLPQTSAVQNQDVYKQATHDNTLTTPQDPEKKNCFMSPWRKERRWENKFFCRAVFQDAALTPDLALITADYRQYVAVKMCLWPCFALTQCLTVWLWCKQWYERSFCLTDLFFVYKVEGDIYTVQMCVPEATPGRLWKYGCHYYSAVPASKWLLPNIFPLSSLR